MTTLANPDRGGVAVLNRDDSPDNGAARETSLRANTRGGELATFDASRAWLFPDGDEHFRGIYTRAGTGFTSEVLAVCSAVAGEGKYRCAEHGVIYPGPRPIEQLERGDWEVHCPHCGACLDPLPIEVKDGPPQPNRLTSAEAKRYASSRPLRRYKPRRKA